MLRAEMSNTNTHQLSNLLFLQSAQQPRGRYRDMGVGGEQAGLPETLESLDQTALWGQTPPASSSSEETHDSSDTWVPQAPLPKAHGLGSSVGRHQFQLEEEQGARNKLGVKTFAA